MRVTFLCSANQCRSVMAEALLRRAAGGIPGTPGADVQVDSAGVGGYGDGAPATPRTVRLLRGHGLDVRAHRSRTATAALLQDSDLVVGMTREHVESARALVPQRPERVFALTELARLVAGGDVDLTTAEGWTRLQQQRRATAGADDEDVPDPVLLGDAVAYDNAYATIRTRVAVLARALGLPTAP